MSDRFATLLGVIAGVAAVCLIMIVVAVIAKKRGKITNLKSKYDERQILARNCAYKTAFFVLLVYLIVNGIATSVLDFQWCDTAIGSFIGICLSILVFVTICIFQDAYIPFKEKLTQNIILFSVVAAVNFAVGFVNLTKENNFVVSGRLTYHSMNFACAILMAVIAFMLIVKRAVNKNSLKTESA